MSLEHARIKNAKPRAKQYTLADSAGLSLLVLPTGNRYFVFRYSYAKKQRSIHIGPFPATSLKQARAKAEQYRGWLAEGRDPLTARNVSSLRQQRATAGTLASVAADWLERNKPSWAPRNYDRH